jgi:hypothetical protein
MGSPLYSARRWQFSPPDEVWSQMSAYWANTGQLDRATVTAWTNAGQDEHGFYELGTQASYGDGWEMGAWSADAECPSWGESAGLADGGVPDAVGVW